MRRPLKIALYLLGLAGLAYYIYDLASPGHFVGDMYGFEVAFRVLILAAVIVSAMLGVMFLSFYWRDHKKTRFRTAGNTIIVLSAVVMIAMAIDVGLSRHREAQKSGFYEKDIAELIQIARTHKNPFAIDVVMSKNDTTAVELLGGILLDQNEAMSIRYRSVNALAYFGTPRSREILAQALESTDDDYLIVMIRHALETIDQAGSNFVPDRALSDTE